MLRSTLPLPISFVHHVWHDLELQSIVGQPLHQIEVGVGRLRPAGMPVMPTDTGYLADELAGQ